MKAHKKYRIALMCAEKEPLDCHRTILVARHIIAQGMEVRHILGDGRIEEHGTLMARLVRQLNLPEGDMFAAPEEVNQEAYRLQENRIAYDTGATATGTEAVQERSRMKLFTIGFPKKSPETFFTRLSKAGVRKLVDVRLNNVSQLAGFTKRDDLRYFTKAICGIEYIHLPELAPTAEILDPYKKAKTTATGISMNGKFLT